jgi:uncharacterized protein YuzE
MIITYDPEADAAYIYLVDIKAKGVKRTRAVPEYEIMLDFDADKRLVGIEVLSARSLLPKSVLDQARPEFPGLSDLAASSLPIDLQRYGQVLTDIEHSVAQLERAPTRNRWGAMRHQYRVAVVVYDMMSVTQQAEVKPRLEALRCRIDALNYQND